MVVVVGARVVVVTVVVEELFGVEGSAMVVVVGVVVGAANIIDYRCIIHQIHDTRNEIKYGQMDTSGNQTFCRKLTCCRG